MLWSLSFTWSWFFQKISKNKKITSKLQKYENMATKFFTPFTPKGVYKNISNKKIKKLIL